MGVVIIGCVGVVIRGDVGTVAVVTTGCVGSVRSIGRSANCYRVAYPTTARNACNRVRGTFRHTLRIDLV